MKPYLDITMVEGWPICAITIGPGRNQDQVYRSVCHFLNHSELKIDRIDLKKLIKSYFEGMREYQLPENKIKECEDSVMELESEYITMGVSYAEKIENVLETYEFTEEEKVIVKDYLDNNFFCDKGVIINKSKCPYEF